MRYLRSYQQQHQVLFPDHHDRVVLRMTQEPGNRLRAGVRTCAVHPVECGHQLLEYPACGILREAAVLRPCEQL